MDDIINYELKYPVKRLSINILEEETVTERVYLNRLEDLAGKTVKQVEVVDGWLCIKFIDCTTAIIVAEGKETAWWSLIKCPSDYLRAKLGDLPKHEYQKMVEEKERQALKAIEAKELKELERLKKKYPLHGNTPQPCLVDPRK